MSNFEIEKGGQHFFSVPLSTSSSSRITAYLQLFSAVTQATFHIGMVCSSVTNRGVWPVREGFLLRQSDYCRSSSNSYCAVHVIALLVKG